MGLKLRQFIYLLNDHFFNFNGGFNWRNTLPCFQNLSFFSFYGLGTNNAYPTHYGLLYFVSIICYTLEGNNPFFRHVVFANFFAQIVCCEQEFRNQFKLYFNGLHGAFASVFLFIKNDFSKLQMGCFCFSQFCYCHQFQNIRFI